MLHQASKNWKDCQEGEDAEEDHHPYSHALFVLLVFFVFLNAIFIFTNTFFRLGRNIDATNSAMLV
mgnify:CR=1 FL=1